MSLESTGQSAKRRLRKRLAAETENWQRLSAVIGRLLALPKEARTR